MRQQELYPGISREDWVSRQQDEYEKELRGWTLKKEALKEKLDREARALRVSAEELKKLHIHHYGPSPEEEERITMAARAGDKSQNYINLLQGMAFDGTGDVQTFFRQMDMIMSKLVAVDPDFSPDMMEIYLWNALKSPGVAPKKGPDGEFFVNPRVYLERLSGDDIDSYPKIKDKLLEKFRKKADGIPEVINRLRLIECGGRPLREYADQFLLELENTQIPDYSLVDIFVKQLPGRVADQLVVHMPGYLSKTFKEVRDWCVDYDTAIRNNPTLTVRTVSRNDRERMLSEKVVRLEREHEELKKYNRHLVDRSKRWANSEAPTLDKWTIRTKITSEVKEQHARESAEQHSHEDAEQRALEYEEKRTADCTRRLKEFFREQQEERESQQRAREDAARRAHEDAARRAREDAEQWVREVTASCAHDNAERIAREQLSRQNASRCLEVAIFENHMVPLPYGSLDLTSSTYSSTSDASASGEGGALTTVTAIPTRISEPEEDATTYLPHDDNCNDLHCTSLDEVTHANTYHSSDRSIIADPLAPDTTELEERETMLDVSNLPLDSQIQSETCIGDVYHSPEASNAVDPSTPKAIAFQKEESVHDDEHVDSGIHIRTLTGWKAMPEDGQNEARSDIALAERESVTRDAHETLKFATPGEPRLSVSESHSMDGRDPYHVWGITAALSPKDLVGVCYWILQFSDQVFTTWSMATPLRLQVPILGGIVQRCWDPGGTWSQATRRGLSAGTCATRSRERWRGPVCIERISRKGKLDLHHPCGNFALKGWHTDRVRPYHLRDENRFATRG